MYLIFKSNLKFVVRKNIMIKGMFVDWNYYFWKLENNVFVNIEIMMVDLSMYV